MLSVGDRVTYQYVWGRGVCESSGVVLSEPSSGNDLQILDDHDAALRSIRRDRIIEIIYGEIPRPKLVVAADRPRVIDPYNSHDWAHLAARCVFGLLGNIMLILFLILFPARWLGHLWYPLAIPVYALAFFAVFVAIRWILTLIFALSGLRIASKGQQV